jgi:putative ABC transport system permease protein
MFLAIREIRRALLRFSLLAGAIALLVFLVLFQQSIQDGLLRGFAGAIENQSAPVLVYNVDGQRVLQGSSIDPELEQLVSDTNGIEAIGRIGQTTVIVDAGEEPVEATVIGFEDAELGAPRTVAEGRLPEQPGEAIGSTVDADAGFGIGDEVRVLPGGLPLTIVGLADDVQLNVGPTLFVLYDTYLSVVAASNPDAGSPLPNALAVVPADGIAPEQLVADINAGSELLDAQTREQAAERTPGVAQVRRTFLVIFALYALVVPCVTGLFFLILTIQKIGPLTLLRAVGAAGPWLVRSLLTQVALVLGAGLALGIGGYFVITRFTVGTLQLRFDVRSVALWVLVFGVLGFVSTLLSARRVMAIEPIDAVSGAVGR